MFENKDFFAPSPAAETTRTQNAIGQIGGYGLHLAKISFLIYSGYHGISAAWNYAGSSELARAAQTFGIVTLEITLLSLYLSWHNHRITGASQSIVAGITYAIGFALACLGIVADSQLHGGGALSGWLVAYIKWGLPLAPAVMALGGILTHELSPDQLRARYEATEKAQFEQEQFEAYMASQRAEMQAQKRLANLQLNAKASAAEQIATWYTSEEAQQAITASAMQNAPALLRQLGVEVDTQSEQPTTPTNPNIVAAVPAPSPFPTMVANGNGSSEASPKV